MDHSWLRFADEVTIHSGRPVGECVLSLQKLTASPRSFATPERKKPFRGRIEAHGGSIRSSLLRYTAVNCRVLEFRFITSEAGAELRGQWKLLNRYRIPVLVYLSFCVISEILGLTGFLLPKLRVGGGLLGPMIGFTMLYGWAWIFVLLSRKSEKQLESAVYHAMAGDESAEIVSDLLSVGISRNSN